MTRFLSFASSSKNTIATLRLNATTLENKLADSEKNASALARERDALKADGKIARARRGSVAEGGPGVHDAIISRRTAELQMQRAGHGRLWPARVG